MWRRGNIIRNVRRLHAWSAPPWPSPGVLLHPSTMDLAKQGLRLNKLVYFSFLSFSGNISVWCERAHVADCGTDPCSMGGETLLENIG